MNKAIRVSVVVTSYNQDKFLEATLCSIIDQEHPYKEIIVIDDGSSDGSVDIIRKYESHLAAWSTGPNRGQSAAVASGLGSTTGEVIGWISSDDILSPGTLARVAAAANGAGASDRLFHGGSEVIDENGEIQEVYAGVPIMPWIARAIGPALCLPGTFFGRTAYTRVGGVDTSLKYCMDLDLWMRFLAHQVPFCCIPEVQGQFRMHRSQKGHSVTWLQHCRDEEQAIRERYGMARKGSAKYLSASLIHYLIRAARGRRHKTMLFRLLQRHRFRQFQVDYSL